MEKLKDEEFRILGEEKPCVEDFDDGMSKVFRMEKAYCLQRQKLRKKNIRAGNGAMDGILTDKTVKNLFELGEIDCKEAIKLDFYASLNSQMRRSYFRIVNDMLTQEIDLYDTINSTLARDIVEFRTYNIFAKSSLNFARNLCMNKSDCDKLTQGQINRKLIDNYKTCMNKYEEIMTAMGDMLFLNEGPFSNNMIDLNILRKTTAKSIVQNAKMLDCYEVINKGNGSLYFCGALSLLRECSLSREAIKIVESSPKTYSKTMGKGFLEMSMHREKSKLIVMDDAKDTPDAPQERQIG